MAVNMWYINITESMTKYINTMNNQTQKINLILLKILISQYLEIFDRFEIERTISFY